ncbi:UDP-forming cellulose synthase catalytic subunit [Tepidimonas taiwanensis]|uniref:UDP-forming cellulose synthase catalytic subunit n=1 Tax=Tepidimonas taiwanensis TaxID=307486 RepID=UPI0009DF6A49|nr:UDP-forming cellulose synthase catalytic subunit [Tepidimonas taiwanensis]
MLHVPTHRARRWVRVLISRRALWIGLMLGLVWLASIPVERTAQAVMAVACLIVLGVIMRLFDRMETQRRREVTWLRLFAIALAVFLSLRYFSWRINYTISYHDFFSFIGALLLLAAELYGLTIYLIGAFVNAYPIERKPPPLPRDPDQLPTVDILIPSYNEDPELLEITLLAATQLRYPKSRYKVYLCDDGGTVQRRQRRDIGAQAWERHRTLKALCERVGAIYVTRERNEHAKAGNLNQALRDHCRGDLVLILDADHVPTADILENTVGFFLQDPKLFLVQTPHYFINPDPLERNLRTYESMPSENEMFYSVIQHGLDFWNASFFCGSAAVLRRAHLDLIGGIAGETITEDAETAMALHGQHGLNSVYYGKPMIAGLQPETFSGFIVQRTRWTQGMVQIFILKNPWKQPKLTIPQRLAYTSSVFFWFFPFARIVFYIAPSLYLLFGLRIVDAYFPMDLLAYTLPHVLGAMMLSNILYGRTRWPLISELYETIQSMHALPSIVATIRHPHAPSFAVTPKGERLDEDFISQLALPFYAIFLFSFVCVIAGVIRLILIPGDLGVIALTMTLAAINMIFSMAAIGIMLEKAQKRSAYRVPAESLDATAEWHSGNTVVSLRFLDVSHGGARFTATQPLPRGTLGAIRATIPAMDNTVADLPSSVVRVRRMTNGQWEIGVRFAPQTIEERRAIVALVYGDSDLHAANQRARQRRIGLAEGFAFLLRLAVTHAAENFQFLTRLAWQKIVSLITPKWQRILQRLFAG